ncbi:phospholipid scramblase 1-like [Apostichopus japonicus]|uniref:phospholipid scramblase 1-like n=1 Tax=Stichopus japonicus TaxID=307972 RepID=UPI003AB2A720
MANTPQFGMTGITAVTSPPGMAPPTLHVPGAVLSWMEKPSATMGCPPGLEYLSQLDQILVHQQVELLEVFTNWETPNKYQMKNILGQQIFFAFEESEECMRQCCGPNRGFEMHIVDNMNQEVMKVSREFNCCAGGSCCAECGDGEEYAHKVTVEAPPGNPIGYVLQRKSFCKPHYAILDENRETLLKIRGPYCTCQTVCCTDDVEFQVLSSDETEQVGKISKQWSGYLKESYTNADNFGIQFPMNLEVKTKAILIGALFLIDFMFFEENQNNNHN